MIIDNGQLPLLDRKNRYGRTAARNHDADGLARRPSSATVDIHAHIVIPQAAKLAQPHVDISRIPLAHFADAATKEINAQQEKDVSEVMTTIDRRLFDLDKMGIDVQVVAPAPGQCYYSIDAKIAEHAHRVANEGVVEYCSRRPDRFVGLGVVTLQEPEIAVSELDYVMRDLKLKGVEILTNVDGQELSDPKFRPFFAKAEALGAFIMMHPNGFTHGERLTHFYLNNVLGNPLDTTLALHNLIFSGTLARFPDLKLMAGARRRLPARLLRADRSRLGRAAGLPWRFAIAPNDLSAASLSRHRGVLLSPASVPDRCLRS